MKILIVDDELDIRRIARLALGRVGGMEVLEAPDGASAVLAARDEQPEAILLDVMMPGLDGPGTLAALRGEPALAGVPVIFLTAKTHRAEIERLTSLGVAGVLSKPFDPMRLAGEVRRILAGE